MKLITAGGFLYSTVLGANADGTDGSYEKFDWVAMFPETQNLNFSASNMNVGWDPMVTSVISSYDGGKVMAGFGKVTGTLYKSWVFKMWGNVGAIPCGATKSITGYVQMLTQLNGTLTAADCILSSNAKVQWAWTTVPTTGLITSTTTYHSDIPFGLTEEVSWGMAGTLTALGADPIYIVAGSATLPNTASWGLLAWSFWVAHIDIDGKDPVDANTGSCTGCATFITNSMEMINSTNNTPYFDKDDAAVIIGGQMMSNSCWTVVHAQNPATPDADVRIMIGGVVNSSQTCLRTAVDGYTLSGLITIARAGNNYGTSDNATPLKNNNTVSWKELTDYTTQHYELTTGSYVTGTAVKGINLGSPVAIGYDWAGAKKQAMYLITSNEYYVNSGLLSVDTAVTATQNMATQTAIVDNVAMAKATYGQLWGMYAFLINQASAAAIGAQEPDNIIFVGQKIGKGIAFRFTLTGSAGAVHPTGALVSTNSFTAATVNDVNKAKIGGPTGGMGQFKGLTQSTTQDKYVLVVCKAVQPLYYTTYAQNLVGGTDNGWVVSCYTGISQCSQDTSATTMTMLSTTDSASCMADVRYMTWRVMTMKLKMDGTQSWYRTDSYWNSACTKFSSTMGTGVVMTTNPYSGVDNTASSTVNTAMLGKTFVFAYGDGSGVQLNHFTFNTGPPTSDKTAGSGTNALTTAPTSFTYSSPNMVNENYCGSSDLLLAGTTDTSGLSDTITAYSDGYKGTLTLNLEMILTGAAGGWRGVCMVKYSSQYMADNTNGSVCFVAQQNSASGSGPTDFGKGYLMHVTSATWQPPANKASLTASSSELTGGKYSISYSPSASAGQVYTAGHYASATWYQPKHATSYTLVARYGKDDYAGAFCMQGSGSNSYFSAPAASVKLTGAIYMAVSAISLGAALSLAM